MTLTITLATNQYVACAADRRLVSGRRVVSEQARKLMIIGNEFNALVAYNGIGSYKPKGSGLNETPNDWVSQASRPNQSLHDFIARLRTIAEPRLRALAPFFPDHGPKHTFVITGFNDGRAFIGTLSNYEDLNGHPSEKAIDQLTWDMREIYGNEYRLLMTGAVHITRGRSRDKLTKAIEDGLIPREVTSRMTKVIRDTSFVDRLKGSVGSGVMSAICYRGGLFEGRASAVGGSDVIDIADSLLDGAEFRDGQLLKSDAAKGHNPAARGDYTKVTYLHGKGERIANVTRQVGS